MTIRHNDVFLRTSLASQRRHNIAYKCDQQFLLEWQFLLIFILYGLWLQYVASVEQLNSMFTANNY